MFLGRVALLGYWEPRSFLSSLFASNIFISEEHYLRHTPQVCNQAVLLRHFPDFAFLLLDFKEVCATLNVRRKENANTNCIRLKYRFSHALSMANLCPNESVSTFSQASWCGPRGFASHCIHSLSTSETLPRGYAAAMERIEWL
jgi:hypothetical protein